MSDYLVGLTGGIACGKSNLTSALKENGVPVVDADEISRSLTAENGAALPPLRKAFGNEIFDGETLNRRRLGQLVFADAEKRETLNGILHPMILQRMREEIDYRPGIVVMDVPLLYECGLEKWCDEVWCAYVPQKEQISRLRQRDGITRRAALQKIHAQMPAPEKARRSQRVIRTDGSMEDSARIVLSLYEELKERLARKEEHRGA